MTTPIIRQLSRDHPGEQIHVVTGYPWVYADNPYVEHTSPPPSIVGHRDRIVDLDLAYERRPRMHIVDAYAEEAGVVMHDKQQEVWFPCARRRAVDRLVPEGAVLLHPARAWENRTLPVAVWKDVFVKLVEADYKVFIIGLPSDLDLNMADAPPRHDLRGHLTPAEVAYAATKAACFVGTDSGLLHVVGATECPIVGIFTCAKAEYRLPYRHGELGWRCKAITPVLDCYGCLADEPPPVTTLGCRRGDTGLHRRDDTGGHRKRCLRNHEGKQWKSARWRT